METRHDFRLNFTTNHGGLMTLNIPRAREAATGAELSAAMAGIIDSGVVQSARGVPNGAYSAELVTTTRRDFNVL